MLILLVLQVTAEHHTLAKYFLELTMVDYDMVHFPPSQVASAAYALTLKVFSCGDWVSICLLFLCFSQLAIYLYITHFLFS